jgi:DNA-binding CsgD family transcriptional regulator
MAMPNGLTAKQDALVRVLASGKAKTQREAAQLVGLAEETVSRTLSKNLNVSAELARLKAERGDRAREIMGKSSRNILGALDHRCPECGAGNPEFSLAAWKVSSDIHANHPTVETQEDVEEQDAELRRRKYAHFMYGIRWTLRALRRGATPEEVAERLLG